ncbi:hypothetical protein BGY98DRAFT_1165941, partial [Russula aff. rugulosa BPL654]
YTLLSAVIRKYPHITTAAFQTYSDILLVVQQWSNLEVVDIPKCGRCAFRGRRSENQNMGACVVPCSLVETLSIGWNLFVTAFSELDNPGEVLWRSVQKTRRLCIINYPRGSLNH